MYPQFPSTVTVQPLLNGNQISMDVLTPQQTEPERVIKLLSNLGWKEIGTDPNNGEGLYQKEDPNMGVGHDADLTTKYWRWYEAMAYEFAKFVNVGLDS